MGKQQGPSGRDETDASSVGQTARWTSALTTTCRSTAPGCRWTGGGGCPRAAQPGAAGGPAPAWGSRTSLRSHTGWGRAGTGSPVVSKPRCCCACHCLGLPGWSCWRMSWCPCLAGMWRSACGRGPWQTALWCKTPAWPLSLSDWTCSAVSPSSAAGGRGAALAVSHFPPLASPKADAILPPLLMALGSTGGPAWCSPSDWRAGRLSHPGCSAAWWLCLLGCRKLSVSSSWAAGCEGRCPGSKWSPSLPWGTGHLGNSIWRWGWGKNTVPWVRPWAHSAVAGSSQVIPAWKGFNVDKTG